MRLNTAARSLAKVREGDRLAIALTVDQHPAADPMPDDLNRALRDEGALDAFRDFPVGKQNHILQWIEAAAQDATREKRIEMAVEVALKRRRRRMNARG